MNSHAVSIGIITQQHRTLGLGKLLRSLEPVLKAHTGELEIIIANNSGSSANAIIDQCIQDSGISKLCKVILIDSPKNNIATGRNITLDHSSHTLLAFLDDDEYVCEQWLQQLLAVMDSCQATVVAGPVPAIFHRTAPHWVHTIDLHNAHGKQNAKQIDNTGTGNVLIDKSAIGDIRFDERYGITGGSDTDFFSRVKQAGGTLYWASQAIAFEDIPQDRSSARYLIHRFIKQGENYRIINTEQGMVRYRLLFSLKAAAVVLISLPVAGVLILIRHRSAGSWVKRAFSNYGKLHSPNQDLYQT